MFSGHVSFDCRFAVRLEDPEESSFAHFVKPFVVVSFSVYFVVSFSAPFVAPFSVYFDPHFVAYTVAHVVDRPIVRCFFRLSLVIWKSIYVRLKHWRCLREKSFKGNGKPPSMKKIAI
jgi:hypothetical protein